MILGGKLYLNCSYPIIKRNVHIVNYSKWRNCFREQTNCMLQIQIHACWKCRLFYSYCRNVTILIIPFHFIIIVVSLMWNKFLSMPFIWHNMFIYKTEWLNLVSLDDVQNRLFAVLMVVTDFIIFSRLRRFLKNGTSDPDNLKTTSEI